MEFDPLYSTPANEIPIFIVPPIASAITGLAGLGLVVALILQKINKETFSMAIASVATFGTTIIGYFAKDQKESHTKP